MILHSLFVASVALAAFGMSLAHAEPDRLQKAEEASRPQDPGHYVTDLELALKLAENERKNIVLFTGHADHLKKLGVSPRDYFELTLMKASPTFATRRSEFVVCERFEFSAMKDAKGRLTPEFAKFIKGWFGKLDDQYDIRFLTPTLTILDSEGKKLAGPIEWNIDFGKNIDAVLKRIPENPR